ncbi:hypothetical protein LNP74_01460 [Klebsiella pneumoniae subsp. pneumoniae]|nr:hypothetical protein [Klebsiella pneumoniae subsp. pneumoniae]
MCIRSIVRYSGNGYVAPGYMNRAYVRSDEHLNTFTVDTQLQSDFATGAVKPYAADRRGLLADA